MNALGVKRVLGVAATALIAAYAIVASLHADSLGPH
jgi:hypothetical protein